MHRSLLRPAFLAAVLAACGPTGPRGWLASPETPPAAAEAGALEPGMPLDDALGRIAVLLDSALAGRLEDDGTAQILRAEAMTDRLGETRLPFLWLAAENYSVEARLWQVQAAADRVVAQIRVGVRRDDLLPDVVALRDEVYRLRAGLADGGTPPPLPIQGVLNALDNPRRTP
jgi:hypothetical protein